MPQENLKTFQTGAIYDATAKGACNFGEVFTTDGRIIALNLKVLEDDRNFFPKYNVSLVLTKDVAKKYPADRGPDRAGGREARPTRCCSSSTPRSTSTGATRPTWPTSG